MVLVVQRDVSGDGVVFAEDAAVHTGARGQSYTLLLLCAVVTQVHHKQLRQRLQHKLKVITANCNQNTDTELRQTLSLQSFLYRTF